MPTTYDGGTGNSTVTIIDSGDLTTILVTGVDLAGFTDPIDTGL